MTVSDSAQSLAGDADACTLCDLPTPDSPYEADDVDGRFCCRGCLEVARRFDATAVETGEDSTEPTEADASATDDVPSDATETFLAIDGMHCGSCEAFLEARATDHEGVHAADASYAADAMRVVHDGAEMGPDALPDLVSTHGYDAHPLSETRGGTRERTLGRLLVGGFLAMMGMLWYLLFLYPAYLGVPADRLLLDVSGPAGRYLLANLWAFATITLGYVGFPILRGAYVSLRAGRPNMDLLVALAASTAYAYSTLALLFGRSEVYFDVTIVVIVAVTLGTYLEARTKERATGRLADIGREQVTARRRTAAGVETVDPEALAGGDEVVVREGETIPADGTVREGHVTVDESLVTGESVPVERAPGDDAIGGATVAAGHCVVEVGEGAESTRERLRRTLWTVRTGRPGAQRLADRLAGAFVPLVCLLAVGAFVVHLFAGAEPTAALLTALAVLVVSCPCALGLATPLAVASGVRTAVERGVVPTDDTLFEREVSPDVVVLDKTGTLTTGEMRVRDAVGDSATLSLAAAVEQYATHPVADAIVAAGEMPGATVESVERHAGGVSGDVDGQRVVVGRADLLRERDIRVPAEFERRATAARETGDVPVFVAREGRPIGLLVVGDEPRPGWERAVDSLGELADVVLLTGDDPATAARFDDHPAVGETFAGVPPDGKAAVVERLQAERGRVLVVGDGSNDGPALAAADLGIALASGTQLAVDAADAVVVDGDLSSVPDFCSLVAAIRRRIRTNLGWAFLYNAVAVPAAALGLLSPVVAAAAMTASSLLVVGNSTRAFGEDGANVELSDET